MVKELKAETNFHYAQITLDGTREVYAQVKGIDKYDQVVSNIKNICDDIKIIIRLNITRNNRESVETLLNELLITNDLDGKVKISLARVQDYFGCDFNNSSCLSPSEFGEYRSYLFENENTKYKSLKRQDLLPAIRRCFCGMENCMSSTIGPQGELYKCEHYFGVESEIIGTVWEGRYYNNAEMCFYSDLDQKCINERCVLLPTCVGGCQSERVQYGIPNNCEDMKRQFCREILAYIRTKE